MSTQTLECAITSWEVTHFTKGDCWMLADAIWMLMPTWTMVAVCVREKNPEDNFLYYEDWVHMAVKTPDGRVVDIEGVHTDLDDYLARWLDEAKNSRSYSHPMAYIYEIEEFEEFDEMVGGQISRFNPSITRTEEIAAHLIAMTS